MATCFKFLKVIGLILFIFGFILSIGGAPYLYLIDSETGKLVTGAPSTTNTHLLTGIGLMVIGHVFKKK